MFNNTDQVFDAQCLENRFINHAGSHCRTATSSRMRIEDNGISRCGHSDDITGESRNGVSAGCNSTDDPKGGIFFHCDAMIAAHSIRFEKFDSRKVFETKQFIDFMVKSSNVGFIKLYLSPLRGVFRSKLFDNVDDSLASGDTFGLKLFVGVLCGLASFGCILKDSEMASPFGRGTAGG